MNSKWVLRGWVTLALATLWFGFLRNAIQPGVSFSLNQDNEYFIGPVLSAISGAFGQGVWPLRMDTVLGGLPLFNFPQLSPFYPFYFSWIDAFKGPLDAARSMHWITLAHVLIAQINMYVLVRILGTSRIAAIFGAAAFAFGANSSGYAAWINITAPYAWLPLYIAGLVGVLKNPERNLYLLMAVCGITFLSLASPAQPLIHAIFISGVLFCVFFICQEKGARWSGTRQALIRMIVVAGLVLLIVAPVLGPSVIELKNSIRWIGPFPPVVGNARIPFDAFQIDQLSFSDLVGVIFRFNDPAVGSPFVGIVVIALAFIGVFFSPKTWIVYSLSFIALYSLFSSAGINFGLAYLNYVIPLLNKIREPSRFLVLFQFAVAALAAIGIDRISAMVESRVVHRLWLVLGALVLIWLSMLPIAITRSVSSVPLIVPLATLTGLALLTWLLARSRVAARAEIVALSWVLGALMLLGSEVRWIAAPIAHSMYATGGGAERDKLFDRLLELDPSREFRVLFDGDVDKQISSMHASYKGIRTLNAYFNPAPFNQFQDLYYHGPRTQNYFQMFGAKYLVCKACADGALSGFDYRESVAGFEIYEAKSVQPFIKMFSTAVDTYGDVGDFLAKLSTQRNAGDVLLLRDGFRDLIAVGSGSSAGCQANLANRSVSEISVDVRCDSKGILQVNEYFSPAWIAKIDGSRADVIQVNGYLVGVAVPAGVHSVKFYYRPSSFYYSLPFGAFGVLLLLGVFVRYQNTKVSFEAFDKYLGPAADKVAAIVAYVYRFFSIGVHNRFKRDDPAGLIERKSPSTNAGVFTYEQFKGTEFFPSLDGLRAIAVVLVIIVHYAGEAGAFLTGWLGVQAFFVLSGFLITTLLLRERDETGSVSIRSFYIRRAFRIMPVYYIIFLFVLWQSYRLGGESWTQIKEAFPYYLTFFNEKTGPAPWKITWTLGIEWKFYLVWPALAFVLVKRDSHRLVCGSLLLAVLFLSFGISWLDAYHYSVLLMGGLLAIVMHHRRGFAAVGFLGHSSVATILALTFIVFQANVGKLVPIFGDSIVANIYGFAVVLLIPAILGNGLPKLVLSSKPFVFVGRRSYALYLVQIIASQAVTGFAPWRTAGWGAAFMVFITGLLIADFLLRYVERPIIQYGRRFDSIRAN
jgi:peptidoglycan/LPS O-acetylase OafA/YrhL